jgi:hypothetical protein
MVEIKAMSAIAYEPLWAYLYGAAIIALTTLPFAFFMWWREARKPGAARRRLKQLKYLKLLDDYRAGQESSRPYSPYKVNTRDA